MAGEVDKALGYFQTNEQRMRYAHFRYLGVFVGSGAVEAGRKAVWGSASSSPGCDGRCGEPPGFNSARNAEGDMTLIDMTSASSRSWSPETIRSALAAIANATMKSSSWSRVAAGLMTGSSTRD
jgi:hypothetical protein